MKTEKCQVESIYIEDRLCIKVCFIYNQICYPVEKIRLNKTPENTLKETILFKQVNRLDDILGPRSFISDICFISHFTFFLVAQENEYSNHSVPYFNNVIHRRKLTTKDLEGNTLSIFLRKNYVSSPSIFFFCTFIFFTNDPRKGQRKSLRFAFWMNEVIGGNLVRMISEITLRDLDCLQPNILFAY